jgi:hypothetical protein
MIVAFDLARAQGTIDAIAAYYVPTKVALWLKTPC